MIKYYCDLCENPINKSVLSVMTLQVPAKDQKESKHLCTVCRKKIDESLKRIIKESKDSKKTSTETFTEAPVYSAKESLDNVSDITKAQIAALTQAAQVELTAYDKVQQVASKLDKKPDWTMSHEICEAFMNSFVDYYEYIENRCMGLDAGKIIALYNAGWACKDIIGEVDFNREDVISEVIFCYEMTGDIPKIKKFVSPMDNPEKAAEKIIADIKTPKKEEEFTSQKDGPMEVPEVLSNVAEPKTKSRGIPIDCIDEFLLPMGVQKGVNNETRKAILIEYCSTENSTLMIARSYGVSQPCVQNLGRKYIDFCVEKGVYEVKKEDIVNPAKIAEFVSTLKRDSRFPSSKRVEVLKMLCTGESMAKTAVQFDTSTTVCSKLLKGYRDYLKEMGE